VPVIKIKTYYKMKFPFIQLTRGHKKKVPETIKSSLLNYFPYAKNIDWDIHKDSYEAIFYLDDVEHIAQISFEGVLTEYKKNLWPDELPAPIAEECKKMGEIMNAIAIFRGSDHFFEVIIRKSSFKRKLLLFNNSSVLINTRKL